MPRESRRGRCPERGRRESEDLPRSERHHDVQVITSYITFSNMLAQQEPLITHAEVQQAWIEYQAQHGIIPDDDDDDDDDDYVYYYDDR